MISSKPARHLECIGFGACVLNCPRKVRDAAWRSDCLEPGQSNGLLVSGQVLFCHDEKKPLGGIAVVGVSISSLVMPREDIKVRRAPLMIHPALFGPVSGAGRHVEAGRATRREFFRVPGLPRRGLLDFDPSPRRSMLAIPSGPVPAKLPHKLPVGPKFRRDQTLDILSTVRVVHDGLMVLAPEHVQNAPVPGLILRAGIRYLFTSGHGCTDQKRSCYPQ